MVAGLKTIKESGSQIVFVFPWILLSSELVLITLVLGSKQMASWIEYCTQLNQWSILLNKHMPYEREAECRCIIEDVHYNCTQFAPSTFSIYMLATKTFFVFMWREISLRTVFVWTVAPVFWGKIIFVSPKRWNNVRMSPPLYRQFMGEIPANISCKYKSCRHLNANMWAWEGWDPLLSLIPCSGNGSSSPGTILGVRLCFRCEQF